jgi:hypothetical protein
VVLAALGYVAYRLWLARIHRSWSDPYDVSRSPEQEAGTNRDPLSPPFPPQAAGDPTQSPVIHDIRWTRRGPTKN